MNEWWAVQQKQQPSSFDWLKEMQDLFDACENSDDSPPIELMTYEEYLRRIEC